MTDIPTRLREALKQPGFTKKGLAERAGIHRMTLQGCDSEDWNPKWSTLQAIEPFLPKIENDLHGEGNSDVSQ